MSQTKTLNGMQLIFEVKSRINHVLSDFVMDPMVLGILLHSFDAQEKSTFFKRQKKQTNKQQLCTVNGCIISKNVFKLGPL